MDHICTELIASARTATNNRPATPHDTERNLTIFFSKSQRNNGNITLSNVLIAMKKNTCSYLPCGIQAPFESYLLQMMVRVVQPLCKKALPRPCLVHAITENFSRFFVTSNLGAYA